MRKSKPLCVFFGIFLLSASLAAGQAGSFTKNFKQFKEVATNVDFFASGPSDIAAFSKPVKDSRQLLANFLPGDLAKGAIVICNTLEQKDAVNETQILKLGYKWVLVQTTPDVAIQQRIAQMKAQMGGMLPPGILERFQNRTPEQKAADEMRLVSSTALRMCYAILMTTLNPEKEYRSSRIEDMGRSPLADWLDIGLAAYASGSWGSNLAFLQPRLDEAFPLEDVLVMPRPFIAPTDTGNSGGGSGNTVIRMGGGDAGGGAPGGSPAGQPGGGTGGQRGGGGGQRGFNLPKDQQDRMLFDGQAAAFFKYAIEKLGDAKVREAVQWNRDGKLTREALFREGYLGTDLDQVEKDWQEWVKKQKVDPGAGMRIMTGGSPKPSGSQE
jgi:hypothetical protein